MDTGTKIKNYRKKCNLTQQSLANMSEISYSQLQKIESGLRTPSENQLARLAKALNVSIDKLEGAKKGMLENEMESFIKSIDRMDVSFEGKKDDDGKFIPETLSLKINGPDYIKRLLSDYADVRESIDYLHQQAQLMPDSIAKNLLDHRAEEICADYFKNIDDKISKYILCNIPVRMNEYLKKGVTPSKGTTILDLLENGYSFRITSFDEKKLYPKVIRFDIRCLCALSDIELLPFFNLAYANGIDSEEKSNDFFLRNEEEYPYIYLNINHIVPSNFTESEYEILNNAMKLAMSHKIGLSYVQDGKTYLTRELTIASCFDSLEAKVIALLVDKKDPHELEEYFMAIKDEFGEDILSYVELLTRGYDETNIYIMNQIAGSGDVMAMNIEMAELMYNMMVLGKSSEVSKFKYNLNKVLLDNIKKELLWINEKKQ